MRKFDAKPRRHRDRGVVHDGGHGIAVRDWVNRQEDGSFCYQTCQDGASGSGQPDGGIVQ